MWLPGTISQSSRWIGGGGGNGGRERGAGGRGGGRLEACLTEGVSCGSQVRSHKAPGGLAGGGETVEGKGRPVDGGPASGDQLRHQLAHRRRELEAVTAHAGGDVKAADGRLVEDRHPVRRDVERPGVALLVVRVRQGRD